MSACNIMFIFQILFQQAHLKHAFLYNRSTDSGKRTNWKDIAALQSKTVQVQKPPTKFCGFLLSSTLSFNKTNRLWFNLCTILFNTCSNFFNIHQNSNPLPGTQYRRLLHYKIAVAPGYRLVISSHLMASLTSSCYAQIKVTYSTTTQPCSLLLYYAQHKTCCSLL